MSFEVNRGQADPEVKYLARGSGYTLLLTEKEAILLLATASPPAMEHRDTSLGTAASEIRGPGAAALRMRLAGGNPEAEVLGVAELPGKSNYFVGSDPRGWRTNIPTFRRVVYQEVYPRVDLTFYGSQGELEYDLTAGPGSDLSALRLEIEGGRPAGINVKGELLLETPVGEVRFRKPIAYQPAEDSTGPQRIEVSYRLERDGRIGFRVGEYDRARPVIIDPVVTFSTYLGGKGADIANGLAAAPSGEVFVIGNTFSQNFPITAQAFDPTPSVNGNVFVTKLNAEGTGLVYSTFFGSGGAGQQIFGNGIAVDSAGNAYITGLTLASAGLPTTPRTVQFGRQQNSAFFAKLDPTGSMLLYGGYLGTSTANGLNQGRGVAVDGAGNVYLAGETQSTDFPVTTSAFQGAFAGGSASCGSEVFCGDAFFAEIDSTGTNILYATYLGGSSGDVGIGIAQDGAGMAYLTGVTFSNDFPTSSGAFKQSAGGGTCGGQACGDAFVAKFDPMQSGRASLIYSTYLGGSKDDKGIGIAADSSGNAFVTGWTTSPDFPTTAGAFQKVCGTDATCNGGFSDAFVTELNPAGTALVYSTYLGGGNSDRGLAIALDVVGNAYVTGDTLSTDFPTTASAPQKSLAGTNSNAFATELSADGSAVLFSTFWGGTGTANSGDSGTGIAVGPAGSVTIGGTTASTDFPTAPAGAFQTALGGLTDSFVAEFSILPEVALSANSLNFMTQNVGTTSTAQAVTLTVTGAQPLAISGITISGPGSGDFIESNNCGNSVSDGSSCSISVEFDPTAPGIRNATLTITDNAGDSPQTVTLTGIGISTSGPGASVAPTSLSFAGQLVTTSSAPQTITLTSSGNQTLTIAGISVTGANSGDFSQANNCGNSLSTGASCTISVTFAPKATGNRSASISVMDNAADSPQIAGLTGTGADFSISPPSGGSTSATVTAGKTATYALQLNPGGFTGLVALSCADAAPASSCMLSTGTVMLNGNTAAPVTVTVTTTAHSELPPLPQRPSFAGYASEAIGLGAWVLLLPLLLGVRNKELPLAPRLALLILLACSGMLAGCGSGGADGSGAGGGASSGTPGGSYAVVVTGTASGVSHALNLTMQVN